MRITRDIKSIVEFIPQEVDILVDEIRESIKIKDDDSKNIRLILEEAIANAIIHGNEYATGLVVTTMIDIEDNVITMTVTDKGKGFDVTKISNPLEEKEQYKSSGRGIYLIKDLADSVSFLDNGRTIKITKKV